MMRSISISWKNKCQVFITQSNCESENYRLGEAKKKKMWLCLLLLKLGHIPIITMVIWIDNQDIISLVKNQEFHKYTKYINMKFY